MSEQEEGDDDSKEAPPPKPKLKMGGETKVPSFSWASKLSAGSSLGSPGSPAAQPGLLQSLTGSLQGDEGAHSLHLHFCQVRNHAPQVFQKYILQNLLNVFNFQQVRQHYQESLKSLQHVLENVMVAHFRLL
jgi:hypothetical protein